MTTLHGDYEPSAYQWVRDQVAEYEASGGQRANTLLDTGMPIIVVATRGAKSGKVRKNPQVVLQDGARTREMSARELTGAERAAWWERAVAAYPPYAEYQEKTDRQIPVFVASPKDA